MVQVSKLSRRIHGWSWQAFPIGMGTGAVYVTLAGLREHWGPKLLSFATIIIGIINYAIPRGTVGPNFIYVLFWLYVGLSVGVCFPLMLIFFNKPHELNKFTPAWAFLMLVGIVAYNVLTVIPLDQPRALGILLTAYAFQGLGFFMTMFYICIYILRSTGFMDGAQATGAFVACGPPGFTALALIHLGEDAREILDARQLVSPAAGEIWYASSVLSALLLFGLAVFFFIFGALPYWYKLHKSLKEILGCWSLTFPNVGWILATAKIGDTFNIEGFHIWNLVMTVLMCATWGVLFILTAIAFWEGKIFNSRPEDVIRDIAVRVTKAGSVSVVVLSCVIVLSHFIIPYI
ncbi:voltage-dependent anion channel-domain-containing protein [Irpex lacteus]|nr:voltage-dependent anion channel-domain-containing protein [Irpex lacteus]